MNLKWKMEMKYDQIKKTLICWTFLNWTSTLTWLLEFKFLVCQPLFQWFRKTNGHSITIIFTINIFNDTVSYQRRGKLSTVRTRFIITITVISAWLSRIIVHLWFTLWNNHTKVTKSKTLFLSSSNEGWKWMKIKNQNNIFSFCIIYPNLL